MLRNDSKRFVFFALAIFVAACEPTSEASDCAVREYQEQAIILDKWPQRRKAAGLPPAMTNFTAFRANLDPWLIEGFVSLRDRVTFWLEARPVESVEELDSHTSFLVIVAPPNFESKKILSKYFEGDYRLINFNEVCPIYVGKRNEAFALATIRDRYTSSGGEHFRECAVVSSLSYFGFPDSELSNYENYIKPDLLPTRWFYDTNKIKLLLSKITKC